MNTIELLDSLEVGMPLIIIFNELPSKIRKVSLYAGTTGNGYYNFIDDSGIFKCSIGYIKEHLIISQELDQDTDLYEVVKLCNKVKKGEVK